MGAVAKRIPASVRRRALERSLDHIRYEQLTTAFLDLYLVNHCLNSVAVYCADPESEHTRRTIAALPNYLLEGEAGLTAQSLSVQV